MIWWWPVIDAVLVCDGKLTPDDNGTETTKLPTDDDGCRDGSKCTTKTNMQHNTNEYIIQNGLRFHKKI